MFKIILAKLFYQNQDYAKDWTFIRVLEIFCLKLRERCFIYWLFYLLFCLLENYIY